MFEAIEIIEKIVSWIGRKWTRKHAVQSELEGLRHALLMTRIVNHLDAPLAQFRLFFQRHPELVRNHPANQHFVQHWLMDPHLQAFGSVPGMWTREKLNKLYADTLALCM